MNQLNKVDMTEFGYKEHQNRCNQCNGGVDSPAELCVEWMIWQVKVPQLQLHALAGSAQSISDKATYKR